MPRSSTPICWRSSQADRWSRRNGPPGGATRRHRVSWRALQQQGRLRRLRGRSPSPPFMPREQRRQRRRHHEVRDHRGLRAVARDVPDADHRRVCGVRRAATVIEVAAIMRGMPLQVGSTRLKNGGRSEIKNSTTKSRYQCLPVRLARRSSQHTSGTGGGDPHGGLTPGCAAETARLSAPEPQAEAPSSGRSRRR
jgi:hypothetical protein